MTLQESNATLSDTGRQIEDNAQRLSDLLCPAGHHL